MWTEESRGRVAKIAKKTKRYPCDLTDEEWERIAPLMPKPGRRGSLSCSLGLWLADAPHSFRALADGL